MPHVEPRSTPPASKPVISSCPQCSGSLVVMHIAPGTTNSEYWTLRCTRCGGIHLDVVSTAPNDTVPTESDELHA
jgi:uncharacterized Zn finger protein